VHNRWVQSGLGGGKEPFPHKGKITAKTTAANNQGAAGRSWGSACFDVRIGGRTDRLTAKTQSLDGQQGSPPMDCSIFSGSPCGFLGDGRG